MNAICKIVKEGQKVELAIGYNDGHKSSILNFFLYKICCDAAFKRIGPRNENIINYKQSTMQATYGKQLTFNENVSVVGTPSTAKNYRYPIDAKDSKQSGYVSANLEYNHIIILLYFVWR